MWRRIRKAIGTIQQVLHIHDTLMAVRAVAVGQRNVQVPEPSNINALIRANSQTQH